MVSMVNSLLLMVEQKWVVQGKLRTKNVDAAVESLWVVVEEMVRAAFWSAEIVAHWCFNGTLEARDAKDKKPSSQEARPCYRRSMD